jgi:RimJ/RimL family protein N-acetyltransferase
MADIPVEEIRIIQFDEADAVEISELFRRIWPLVTEYPEEWRKNRMYSPEEVIEEMRSGHLYFGSRLRGEIVGVYKARITEKGLYGEHQTVQAECRGTGLASAMYHQFEVYGREHGCQRLYCNILVGHRVGERLMEKFGFRKWGDPYEQVEGMWVQLFEKPL